ncbi:MAG: hypothetical protein ACK4X1_04050 [Terricaulis sp.]
MFERNAPGDLRTDRQMQLGFFDIASPGSCGAEPVATPPAQAAVPQTKRRARAQIEMVTITPQDLPDYPYDVVQQVEQEIAEIPTDRVLLTYREIWGYFGISRATVSRRMKDGLVPGIRMSGGRVLDDGPVRRFNRAQIRWLLLAVRRPRSIHPA